MLKPSCHFESPASFATNRASKTAKRGQEVQLAEPRTSQAKFDALSRQGKPKHMLSKWNRSGFSPGTRLHSAITLQSRGGSEVCIYVALRARDLRTQLMLQNIKHKEVASPKKECRTVCIELPQSGQVLQQQPYRH